MLEFELAVQDPVVVKLVTEVNDRARQVDRVSLFIGADRRAVMGSAGVVVVDKLAVATQRDAMVGAVDLGSCRAQPVNALVGSKLRGCPGLSSSLTV